jgi:hypothetical protein
MKFLQAILDYLLEEPQIEKLSQPESLYIAKKRFEAQEYLRTKSPNWRNRRNQNALKDPSGANEGSAS